MSAEPIVVLHVDDEPDFADMVASFVERQDERLAVLTAERPAEGLDQLDEHDVDCIVTDYDMPKTNGLEFMDAVRERYPALPFVLFTGKGSEEIASEAISAGVTDYLQKATGTEQYQLLANQITNAVEQYRAERAAERTQRRLLELTETTTDVFWMFSHDWSELLFVNSAYEDVWGRSIETLRDDPADFLAGVHPEDRSRVEAAMERLSGGDAVDLEYRVNPEEDYGRRVWVQGEPIYQNEAVVRVTGFARDVSDRG